MPKGTNQKLKLYYLAKILLEQTDDEHGLTMPDILEELDRYEVSADRKSIYTDIEALNDIGLDVVGEKSGKYFVYHIGSRRFELAELKLLVDAIGSFKFITEKKSNALIKKLTTLASTYEATQLERQLAVQGRVKTMNESIYYTVDEIHSAISENKKISFKYMTWDTEKKLVPRKAEPYVISPWRLTWNDENYYLIAFDSESGKIKHYRVDKMDKIEILDERREGKEHFKAFDLAAYTNRAFGMFGGEGTMVTLTVKDEMVGVIIDRFGKNITIKPSKKKGWSDARVEVAVSDQFFGWIFGLGTSVKISAPASVVKAYKTEINNLLEFYK
ncbi:Predicted DNA-binding transcriptional regulator YafY, contains an HTH and WYL domains [Butyrivibrio sp. ob235]|uniref:helix-turn-helix transcriptional regulator n=1 Tax=unclassified Butyrivibrio TaxID=2639466 RepID=UPI0003B652D6|nr:MULTISPECIES: WYL domain-containing protein [unclassified Butyrivibrio]SEL82809.1 Predicted DNA-binding transcriptional regulator YafY, contains an HTH and WYL domains [Butyrivibrio sp. ob235]